MTATVEGMVADTLPLHVEIKADTKQLSFTGRGTEPVASIAPIVELFNLGPSISPWIVDYLSASQISLSSISGTIPYDKPESILQTLHAIADVKETEYTFAQGLEPIKAAQTEVEFINGVLKIKPYEATFYGQDAGNSELDINFSKQPFILTTYIRTSAQASGGILTLLEHYGIPFPFEQKTGLTKTDLTLAINLSTIDIQSKGTFKRPPSRLSLTGTRLMWISWMSISTTQISLFIESMSVKKIYSQPALKANWMQQKTPAICVPALVTSHIIRKILGCC